jgi:hypothetical protein
LIGCSLGGIYARELARDLPGAVRQVITLGTPLHLRGSGSQRRRNRGGLGVPSTSIYSQLDGVVDWRSCLDDPGERRENVAVMASHHGLAHHPASLWVVADRLAQDVGAWRPFQAQASWQRVVPTPAPPRRQGRAAA